MALSSRAVTVTTAPTLLDAVGDDNAINQSFSFYNGSAVIVYVGGSDVSSTNGAPVAADSWSPGMDLGSGDNVYGIVATGTAEVRVLEVGV